MTRKIRITTGDLRVEAELNELKTLMNEKTAGSEKPSPPEKAAPKPAEGFSLKSYGFIKLAIGKIYFC